MNEGGKTTQNNTKRGKEKHKREKGQRTGGKKKKRERENPNNGKPDYGGERGDWEEFLSDHEQTA